MSLITQCTSKSPTEPCTRLFHYHYTVSFKCDETAKTFHPFAVAFSPYRGFRPKGAAFKRPPDLRPDYSARKKDTRNILTMSAPQNDAEKPVRACIRIFGHVLVFYNACCPKRRGAAEIAHIYHTIITLISNYIEVYIRIYKSKWFSIGNGRGTATEWRHAKARRVRARFCENFIRNAEEWNKTNLIWLNKAKRHDNVSIKRMKKKWCCVWGARGRVGEYFRGGVFRIVG